MTAFPPLSNFTTQLLPNEHLLRGGFLKKAVIFDDVELIDNRKFIKLCTNVTVLRSYFTNNSKNRCHVLQRLFAFVAELRDGKQLEWETNARPSKAQEDEVLDSLGDEVQDDLTPRAPAAKPLSPLLKKALRKQFPFVTIDFTLRDEVVAMRVKSVATKSEQPRVEAADENFRALFCWYQNEAALAEGASPAPKPRALFEPRVTSEGREYYRKSRSGYYLMRSVGP